MNTKMQAESKIERAAEQAMQVLAQASDLATKAIATAASNATVVISSAVMEASKLQASAISKDHDLLVTLNTEMQGLKEDIRNLRDEQVEKVSDHEARINKLESSNIREVVALSVGALWLAALTAMVIWHLFNVPVG
jgi:hypothetical protein